MKKILPLLAIAFLLITTPVFANSENKHEKKDKSRFELRIGGQEHENGNRLSRPDGRDSLIFQNRKSDDDDDNRTKIKIDIEDSEFEIQGEIESIGTNSFVVAGQTINIDPSRVSKFKQKGILEVGNSAKVEGIIVDGSKFAESIKLIGTGQGRFKFEIRGLSFLNSSSPTPGASPSVSPSASPGASPTVSPTPSVSPNVKVKIKANGPIDEVVTFLQQILGFLGNIVSPGLSPSPSPSPSVEPSPSPSPTVTIQGQELPPEESVNPFLAMIATLEDLIAKLKNLL